MKICDVSEFYSEQGGGVRTYVQQKLAASARLGHETIIIAPGPVDREEVRPGGKIVWVKAPVLIVDPRYHIFAGMSRALKVLDREQPDVVEGSSPWRGGWIAARWPGPAVKALFMHADPVAVYPQTLLGGLIGRARVDALFGWFWAYLRRLNRNFDVTVVSGEWLAKRFESFGMQHLRAVPMGVDRHIFYPTRRDENLKRTMLAACGLNENARVLISVGRHHPEKRLNTVMEAAALANTRDKPIGLYLVGDGITRQAVERKAAQLNSGSGAHIHVAGQIKDRDYLAGLMASADGVLHGSASETFGIAVAEALCCGAPIVVPDAGGAADFAHPDVGEVYAAGNAKEGSKAVLRLLARDQESLRRAAIERADKTIGNADAHFDKLLALYQSLIDEKARRQKAT
jgi:alpha-1,6-mannosyltransferase